MRGLLSFRAKAQNPAGFSRDATQYQFIGASNKGQAYSGTGFPTVLRPLLCYVRARCEWVKLLPCETSSPITRPQNFQLATVDCKLAAWPNAQFSLVFSPK